MFFFVWYENRPEPCVSVVFCSLNIAHIPPLSENGASDDLVKYQHNSPQHII